MYTATIKIKGLDSGVYLDGKIITGTSAEEKYNSILNKLYINETANPEPTKDKKKTNLNKVKLLYIINIASDVGHLMRDTFNNDSRIKELYQKKNHLHELTIINDSDFENLLKEKMINHDLEYVMNLGIDEARKKNNDNSIKNNYIYPAYYFNNNDSSIDPADFFNNKNDKNSIKQRIYIDQYYLFNNTGFRAFNRQDFVTVIKSNFTVEQFNESLKNNTWQKGKQNYGFEIDETYSKWKDIANQKI